MLQEILCSLPILRQRFSGIKKIFQKFTVIPIRSFSQTALLLLNFTERFLRICPRAMDFTVLI